MQASRVEWPSCPEATKFIDQFEFLAERQGTAKISGQRANSSHPSTVFWQDSDLVRQLVQINDFDVMMKVVEAVAGMSGGCLRLRYCQC